MSDKTEKIEGLIAGLLDGATERLPRDPFTTSWRRWSNHPEAIARSSRIDLTDDYGRLETWTIDTFTFEGKTTAFLQRMSTGGEGLRLLLPPEVTRVFASHKTSAKQARRVQAALKAVATRRARGDVIGNPEALAKARKSKRKK